MAFGDASAGVTSDRQLAASRILRHAPEKLPSRESWLAELNRAWASATGSGNPGARIPADGIPDSEQGTSRPEGQHGTSNFDIPCSTSDIPAASADPLKLNHANVYTLVAWGGVGKTSLVAHCVRQRFAAQGWPGIGGISTGRSTARETSEPRQTSSGLFISRALTFLGDDDPTDDSPWERGERLARLVRKRHTLLVLDGSGTQAGRTTVRRGGGSARGRPRNAGPLGVQGDDRVRAVTQRRNGHHV